MRHYQRDECNHSHHVRVTHRDLVKLCDRLQAGLDRLRKCKGFTVEINHDWETVGIGVGAHDTGNITRYDGALISAIEHEAHWYLRRETAGNTIHPSYPYGPREVVEVKERT
jgi:hypothetical protein